MSEAVVKCPKCGVNLINVGDYSLCPKGCGGLFPKVSGDDHTKGVRSMRRASLPIAIPLETMRSYCVGGEETFVSSTFYKVASSLKGQEFERGLFRRVARESVSLNPKHIPAGDVLAVEKGTDRVIQLRVDLRADAEVRGVYALFGLADLADTCAAVDQAAHQEVDSAKGQKCECMASNLSEIDEAV